MASKRNNEGTPGEGAPTSKKARKAKNTVKPTVSGVVTGVAVPAVGRASSIYPFHQLTEHGQMFFVQGTSVESMRGTCYQRSKGLAKRREEKGLPAARYVAKPHTATGAEGVEAGTKGVGVWFVVDSQEEAA